LTEGSTDHDPAFGLAGLAGFTPNRAGAEVLHGAISDVGLFPKPIDVI